MWLFLLTEIMMFGGLFLLYAAYRVRFPQEFGTSARQLNLWLGAANARHPADGKLLHHPLADRPAPRRAQARRDPAGDHRRDGGAVSVQPLPGVVRTRSAQGIYPELAAPGPHGPRGNSLLRPVLRHPGAARPARADRLDHPGGHRGDDRPRRGDSRRHRSSWRTRPCSGTWSISSGSSSFRCTI